MVARGQVAELAVSRQLWALDQKGKVVSRLRGTVTYNTECVLPVRMHEVRRTARLFSKRGAVSLGACDAVMKARPR